MAKRKKRKGEDSTPEGIVHNPRQVHPHIAREYRDIHSADDTDSLVRKLLPHMRDRVLGYPRGTTTHKGWTPSVRDPKF